MKYRTHFAVVEVLNNKTGISLYRPYFRTELRQYIEDAIDKLFKGELQRIRWRDMS